MVWQLLAPGLGSKGPDGRTPPLHLMYGFSNKAIGKRATGNLAGAKTRCRLKSTAHPNVCNSAEKNIDENMSLIRRFEVGLQFIPAR